MASTIYSFISYAVPFLGLDFSALNITMENTKGKNE